MRLYDNLFTKPDPDDVPEGHDYKANLNPQSLVTLTDCRVEPSLAAAKAGERFQFERLGLFLRRSGFHAWRPGLQPHGDAARHLGQNRERPEKVRLKRDSTASRLVA